MVEPTRTLSVPADPAATTLPNPGGSTPDDLPTALPGYELLDEIGRGGMGVVYRARDRELNREVAVKVLQARYPVGSDMAKRFVAEAQITGQLQHPGIPPVYRVGSFPDGRPFLAMKLIRGRTLDELLKDRGPEAGHWLGVFEGICQAVGYAHAHGLVHRDLKPSNVMVGAFGEVQVMDWGLAKAVRSEESGVRSEDRTPHSSLLTPHSPETEAGSILGTPAYMAPEQAAGAVHQIDRRTDVFGLGAILCTLLTGQPPFVGTLIWSTRQLAERAALDGAFARLAACGAEPDLVGLCRRCLAASQDDRPADATAVAADVAALRAAADERARQAQTDRDKAEVRAAEQAKQRRIVQWAGGTVAAVLALGVAGTTVGLVRAEARRQEADNARANEAARADGERRAKEREAEQRAEAEAAARAAAIAKVRAEQAEADTLDVFRQATDDAVEKLIGSKPVLGPRETAYLEDLLKRWQKFADRAGTDVRARAIRAEAHRRLGLLWAKLGRPDRAVPEFEAACTALTALAAEHPTADYRLILVDAHRNLGTSLKDKGEPKRAEHQFRESLKIATALAAADPNAADVRTGLAHSHIALGAMLDEMGDGDGAEPEYRKGLAECERLLAVAPNDRGVRAVQVNGLINLGLVLGDKGKGTEAGQRFGDAITVLGSLLKDAPDDPKYRFELAAGHGHLGLLFRAKRDPAKAEAELKTGRDLNAKLAAEFPAVPEYRAALAVAHNHLALVLEDQRKRAAAEAEFKAGIQVQERLVAEFATRPAYKVELGGSYCNLGEMVRKNGAPADSLPWFGKAIAVLEPVSRTGKDPLARQFLRNSHWRRAIAHDALGKHKEAAADWGVTIDLSPSEDRRWHRANRASSVARAGQPAAAVAEVTELTKLPEWGAEQWYDFACVYALAIGKVAGKDAEYAARAMELLQRAVKVGFKDAAHLREDGDLTPLRDRDDFKKLLADLEKKAPKAKPPGPK